MRTKKRVAALIATGLGSGLSPKAPGTAGSLVAAIIIYWIDLAVGGIESLWLLTAIVVTYVVGHWACAMLEEDWGHDPGKIVIDEWVGMGLAVLVVPITWQSLALAFVAFRFFDILKPLGVGYIDKQLSGPLSVMLDDVLAGIYAAVITWLFCTMVGI